MRRSTQVIAPLLATAAVSLLSGCKSREPKNCVDEFNHVVDTVFCQDQTGTKPAQGTLENGGGFYTHGVFYPHYYQYYYGGQDHGLGSVISGGSYTPLAGHTYSFSSGSSSVRGGFGSSFSGEGGGGGE